MTSGRIILRAADPSRIPGKREVLEILQGRNRLWLTSLRQIKNGYLAITEFEGEIEKILTDAGRTSLEKIGLEVTVPPKVKAQRAILCRKVDPYIGENSAMDIKNEINAKNEALTCKEVIKFGEHTHVFRAEFATSEMAKRACERGILAFSLKITPDNIKQEKYVELLMCFHCYQLESHISKDCPFLNQPKRCSECSGLHSYTECERGTPQKCLNCPPDSPNNNHRTMAMKCPIRKKLIREKTIRAEERENEEKNKTFAAAAKVALDQQQKQQRQQQQQEHLVCDIYPKNNSLLR